MDSDTNNFGKDTEEEKRKRREDLWRRKSNLFIFFLCAVLLLSAILGPAMISNAWFWRILCSLMALSLLFDLIFIFLGRKK